MMVLARMEKEWLQRRLTGGDDDDGDGVEHLLSVPAGESCLALWEVVKIVSQEALYLTDLCCGSRWPAA